jgi:hypothetical protein
LNASEINENLMRQSVMVFSNAAARTAAITSPVEGMLTWLEDVNRYESYNGSAWVSPFGSTLVASSIFTSQTSVALDNIFTADYRYYDFYFQAQNSGAAGGMQVRLRTGSADASPNSYFGQRITGNGTTVTAEQNNPGSDWTIGVIRTTGPTYIQGSISNPFVVTETAMVTSSFDRANQATFGAFNHPTVGSYNGIRFFNGGSMTGSVFVYGRRV